MFNELDCVILTKPLLEGDVPVGCTGVILMVYTEPTAGYEVEFFDTTHKSLGTFTITDDAHRERQR
jgi:hypothetical protein